MSLSSLYLQPGEALLLEFFENNLSLYHLSSSGLSSFQCGFAYYLQIFIKLAYSVFLDSSCFSKTFKLINGVLTLLFKLR